MLTYTLILWLLAPVPWQRGPRITCDIYPAPNGGFTEQCHQTTAPKDGTLLRTPDRARSTGRTNDD